MFDLTRGALAELDAGERCLPRLHHEEQVVTPREPFLDLVVARGPHVDEDALHALQPIADDGKNDILLREMNAVLKQLFLGERREMLDDFQRMEAEVGGR